MTVMSFDSMDEMAAVLAANRERADANVHPIQKSVTYGSHYIQPYPQPTGVLVIFGYVPTLEEIETGEREYEPKWDDKDNTYADAAAFDKAVAEFSEEVTETLANTKNMHEANMLYVTASSVIEADGELGHVHRASVWPISKEIYEAAKEAGWKVGKQHTTLAVHVEIMQALQLFNVVQSAVATGIDVNTIVIDYTEEATK